MKMVWVSYNARNIFSEFIGTVLNTLYVLILLILITTLEVNTIFIHILQMKKMNAEVKYLLRVPELESELK